MWQSYLPISCFTLLFSFSTTSLACPDPWEALELPDGTVIGGAPEPLAARNESDHDKRWIQMVPDSQGYGALWPNGVITACLDSSMAQQDSTDMELSLVAAWKLWVDAGIDPNVQNFRIGSSGDCLTAASQVLTVELSTDGTMHSNLGKLAAGSTMVLNPSNNMGTGDKIANYAHEIGHAFGLLHEHQRPDYWTQEYGGTAVTPTFFFNCFNLADFAALENNPDVGTYWADQACLKYNLAAQFSFSASAFLPFPAGGSVVYGGPLDLKSIMMYPSRAGGINTGTTIATRKLVYTLWDGTEILPKLVPSQRDVQNMKSLYPATAPQTTPCFVFQSCSPFQFLFNLVVGCARPTSN